MGKTDLPIGIDIGGTGIKGAPVDLQKGAFADDRLRIPTPDVSTPKAVLEVVDQIVQHFDNIKSSSPIGITVPGVVKHGAVQTAANIDPSWIGFDAAAMFSKKLGRAVHLVNDADAAGVAEQHYGAARKTKGLVIVTTLGTGIGTALIYNGALIPNSEFGHLEIDGRGAETVAAASAHEREELSWQEWAERLQRYYSEMEKLFWPDLFVVGGGVSKQADKFLHLLDLRTDIVAAKLKNKAGIIGAAHLAAREH
ncbi:polyphosphate--glucose phosphotransferase [Janibacter sp. GXQ6167]|uniref:polyphosphate--glucose phosphotransferase n=1 Tax=Janibacter sp. GXQ6167 TaxID=3240791 RepID=UPI003524CB8E